MNSAPLSARYLLYLLRPLSALETDYNEYTKMYKFIVVDGVGYYADEKEKWRVSEWLETPEMGIKSMTLPDAIVLGKTALKNRYGYNKITEKLDALHKALSEKKVTAVQYTAQINSFVKLLEI